MSECVVRIKRDVTVNVLGLQARYLAGEIVGLRNAQAEMLVGLGDAEYYKIDSGPAENKMEMGPVENKNEVVVEIEVNEDAAKYADDHGIDLEQVVGTGKGGRITLRDVKAFEKASKG